MPKSDFNKVAKQATFRSFKATLLKSRFGMRVLL